MRDYLKLIPSLILSVAMLLLFSQCSKDKEQDEPKIDNITSSDFVGIWEFYDGYYNYLIFKSNGNGWEIVYDDDNYRYVKKSITWEYIKPILTIRDSEGRNKFNVKSSSSDEIILTSLYDDEYVLRRVDEYDLPDFDDNNSGDDDPWGGDDDDPLGGDDDPLGGGDDPWSGGDDPWSGGDDPWSGGGDYNDTYIKTLDADPRAFRATLAGQYNGSKTPTSVGVEYSYYNTFPERKTKQVSTNGKYGRFEVTATGLVDQITVYYRAFANIDGKYEYGDIKSFVTKPGTYTIDGVTYNFIKVTGLSTGSFSMMQTELPPDAEIEIDGIKVGRLNSDSSNPVTKGETRDFMNNFAKAAVVPRYPTAQEWIFASSGGKASNGFTYSGSNDINAVAWYSENSNNHARKPALKKPNELGFYDMIGNYAELCSNYDSYELEDIIEKYICRFINALTDVSAAYFNTSWDASCGAFGGKWDSTSNQCKYNSSETYNAPSTNRYDSSRYTVRLVYSRPD